jgi:hypothetical protein
MRGGDYLQSNLSLMPADLISANPSLPEQSTESKVEEKLCNRGTERKKRITLPWVHRVKTRRIK